MQRRAKSQNTQQETFCLLTFWANKTERRRKAMSRGIVSQNVLCIHTVVDARCRIYMFQFSWYVLQILKLNEYITSIQCTNNPLYLVTYEIYRQLSIILVVILLNTIWFRNNYWWCHRPLVTDCRDAFVHNTPPRIALVCIFLDWPFKLLICNLTLLKCMRLSSIHQTN